MSNVIVEAKSSLKGSVRVPGDKSASHRAVILSALADGTSTIEGLSPGLDVHGTATIAAQLGASVAIDGSVVSITGPRDGLVASSTPLDCGNSGTTIRLLSGVVASVDGRHTLIGDHSLSRRPMDRVAIPLRLMGASIGGEGARETPPLTIDGSNLSGIDYTVPVPSAQVKSAILLAALRASGDTVVRESLRTRTTTEDMLRHSGVTLSSTPEGEGRVIHLRSGRPSPQRWRVPTDPSQAAFFAVLGLIASNTTIRILDVEASPERIGFVSVLQRLGGDVVVERGDGIATLHVASSALTATEIHASEIPSVDEAPILSIAAAAATGVTAFRDMGELRLKESDRFAGCMLLARSVGATTWSEGDDFFIEGLGSAAQFSSFAIDPGLDHRMVMSAAVAGTAGRGCTIENPETVSSSYPGFFHDLAQLA